MKTISTVAFEDRVGRFVFVKVPGDRGRYLRTDRSVVLVSCPLCSAVVGEPCSGARGYGGTTHHIRRRKALFEFGHGMPGDDLLDEEDGAVFVPDAVPDEHMEAAA